MTNFASVSPRTPSFLSVFYTSCAFFLAALFGFFLHFFKHFFFLDFLAFLPFFFFLFLLNLALRFLPFALRFRN